MKSLALCVLVVLLVPAGVDGRDTGAGPKSWKTLAEMSAEEKAGLDFRTDTPRSPAVPYLPAEPYPFEAPYTAEELGYRSMEFTHVSRWSYVMADAFGSMTSGGYLHQGVTIGLNFYMPAEAGLAGQLQTLPGQDFFRMVFYYTAPSEMLGAQDLWILRRTDRDTTTKLDYFAYAPALRRVRRIPQPRRGERFPNNVQSFDDIIGRDAWEFSWRVLGTDVLYETVRFPNTRPSLTLAKPDGTFFDRPTTQLKMMWDNYPFYRSDGGVACYVVEATTRQEWLPNYPTSKLIYWLDRHYFYPLRIEQYDHDGQLQVVEVRIARQDNPALGDTGYAALLTVYYDVSLDLMSYSIHDAHLLKTWSDKDKAVVFGPDFMRRGWLMHPLKTQTLVNTPDEFYMRPRLYPDKFPQDRTVVLSPEVAARIRAQEAAGRLVFETPLELAEVKGQPPALAAAGEEPGPNTSAERRPQR